ncbi:MAG TPA: HPF/RaiA family ribosome-associated protein, partial [Opitutaceae bacterium]|nr:HPF/RaiA family ribosome-associated protein [Opitutaceae bacterium]
MKINVRSRTSQVTPSIREWAERRVLFALGQFSARLRVVHVCLSDENGPKGGADQRCLMEARMTPGRGVVAEDRDPDLYAAVSRAAERLGRRVR